MFVRDVRPNPNANPHSLKELYALAHTHARTHARMHARTHTTHARTHACTHARACAHTHMPSVLQREAGLGLGLGRYWLDVAMSYPGKIMARHSDLPAAFE